MAQRHKRTAVVFVLVLFFCSTANAQAEVPSLEVHAKGTGADAGLAASTSSSSDAASQPGGVMKPHVATLAGPPLAHPPPPAPHPAALPRPRFRNLYLIRHGEAAKNTGSSKSAADYDYLTQLGRQQAAAMAARLCRSVSLSAAESAAEQRTKDTAAAIANACRLPTPLPFDANLTSSIKGETDEARAERGIAALQRFLAKTKGDVAVVSHGHIINLMMASINGVPLTAEVLNLEMVNAGVAHYRLGGMDTSTWQQLETDQLVLDDN